MTTSAFAVLLSRSFVQSHVASERIGSFRPSASSIAPATNRPAYQVFVRALTRMRFLPWTRNGLMS